MKNITQIKKELLKREAGKAEVNAAQMGDVLAHLCDMCFEDGDVLTALFKNGKRRAKKK